MPRNAAAAPSPDEPRRIKPRSQVTPIGTRRRRPPAADALPRTEDTAGYVPVRTASMREDEYIARRPEGRLPRTSRETAVADAWNRGNRNEESARLLTRRYAIAPGVLGQLCNWDPSRDARLFMAAEDAFRGLRDIITDARRPLR